MIVLSVPYSDW